MRMHHAAAEDLDPALALAEPAALATAFEAGDIHLCGRLREREMVRTEFGFRPLAKQFFGKYIQSPLQIGKCYPLVDHKPLDLVEGRRMGRIHFIRAENTPRRDHADRQLSLFHNPGLNRRCLSPEKYVVRDIEGILLILCGMVGRDIQLGEIVLVILDFRSFNHLVSHSDKDPFHIFKGNRIRMAVADALFFRGKGYVDGLAAKPPVEFLLLKSPALLLYHFLDDVARFIDVFANLRPLLGRHILHRFEDRRQGALFPKHCHADFIQLLQAIR